MDIQFKRGEKQSFIAARAFALGNTGLTLSKGQEILFDGSTADVGGDEMSLPSLRGAIKAGWLTLAENYDEFDREAERPLSAGIQVHHPTQGGNPMDPRTRTAARTTMTTTETDEREVGNVGQHAAQAKNANTNYRRGQPVNRSGMVGNAESQDGVEVARLKTPSGERAKQTRTILTAGSVGQAMKDTEVTITAGQGQTEEEYLARLPRQEAEEYLAKKGALRAQYVDEGAPKVVGRVKQTKAPTQREGITAAMSVGGGIETGDLQGMDPGKARHDTVESEGMTFRTTNGPKAAPQAHPRDEGRPTTGVVVKQASVDVRRMVAKQLCSDFPDNYDFGAADKKKLARLQADYEDRHDVLKAVFAAEGDAFKSVLIQEFPEAFQS